MSMLFWCKFNDFSSIIQENQGLFLLLCKIFTVLFDRTEKQSIFSEENTVFSI